MKDHFITQLLRYVVKNSFKAVVIYFHVVYATFQVKLSLVVGCFNRLPRITVPSLSLVARILPDAFVIAIVSFAVNISIAKMFAKKHKYSIDANQVTKQGLL